MNLKITAILKKFTVPIILICVLSILFTSCGNVTQNKVNQVGSGNSGLYGVVLNTGKSDAIILTADGETMIIDTGEAENGKDVLSYLKENNINKVKYLLITHYDNDHVGGAATVLNGVEVENVIVPDYVRDSTNYINFQNALKSKNITPTLAVQQTDITLGKSDIIISPTNREEEYKKDSDDNAFSIVAMLSYGEKKILFAGDAEKNRINELLSSGMDLKCDLIKIPHHGGKDGNASEKLAEAVQAEYGIITDSSDEPADQKVISAYNEQNTKIFETVNGSVVFQSKNGSDLIVDYVD